VRQLFLVLQRDMHTQPETSVLVHFAQVSNWEKIFTRLNWLSQCRSIQSRDRSCSAWVELAGTIETSTTTASRQKRSVESTFLGEPDFSLGIRSYACDRATRRTGWRKIPYACTSYQPRPTTLEQGIAYRLEETSRAEARLVHTSSPRNRPI
jgi:hypothetical protein